MSYHGHRFGDRRGQVRRNPKWTPQLFAPWVIMSLPREFDPPDPFVADSFDFGHETSTRGIGRDEKLIRTKRVNAVRVTKLHTAPTLFSPRHHVEELNAHHLELVPRFLPMFHVHDENPEFQRQTNVFKEPQG